MTTRSTLSTSPALASLTTLATLPIPITSVVAAKTALTKVRHVTTLTARVIERKKCAFTGRDKRKNHGHFLASGTTVIYRRTSKTTVIRGSSPR